VAVGDGQRRAGVAVTSLDLAFAGGAPHGIGDIGVARGAAWMPDGTALARLRGQAVAAAEVTDGRAGRPGPVGRTGPEERHPRLGAPGGRPVPGVKDRCHHMVRRLAGRGRGPPRSFCEALGAGGR